MRLIACPSCHAQYDVTRVVEEKVSCRCGEMLQNRELESRTAEVLRCGSCGAQAGPITAECEYCGAAIIRDKRKLSLVCPECYARNSDDARYCGACGVTFDPRQVGADGEPIPCPRCECLMPALEVAGVALNECAECNGIWVPGENMNRLVDRAIEASKAGRSAQDVRVKSANPSNQTIQYRRCPSCESFMQRRNFRKSSGIIIDVCVEHGTWLDPDELEAIAGFITSGGRPAAEKFLKDQEVADRAPAHRPASSPRVPYSHRSSDFGDAGFNHPVGTAFRLIEFLLNLLD